MSDPWHESSGSARAGETEPLTIDAVPTARLAPAHQRSAALARALRATASPRRGPGIGGHELTGALRERRRWQLAVLATALGLAVLLLFFLWEYGNASGVTYSHWGALGPSAGDDYDEGAYVISAQLINRGYALFSQIFSAQPAFFLPSLAVMVRWIGDPVVAGHLYEAVFGAVTLAGVFWMAWTAYRPLAAPLAAALLAVSPGFLLYAHAVEAEMPMLGLCTLSVAAAQAYYLRPRRAVAGLAGLLLIAGTEMKLLSPVVAPAVLLLLCGGAWRAHRAGRSWRAIVADALAFALCFVVPALVVLVLYAPAEQLRQVISFHLHAGTGPRDAADNLRALRTFLGYDRGLLVAAVVGGIAALVTQSGRAAPARFLTLVYAVWFLFTLLFLWSYHPLFQHQFVPLLPPLALLGGGLVTLWPAPARYGDTAISRSGAWMGQPAFAMRAGRYVALATAAVYAVFLVSRTLPLDAHLFAPPVTPRRDSLVALVDRTTHPGDFVVCDDPMVALFAHRLMPPGLADPSRVRTTSGYLPVSEAVQQTEQYHVAAIVASRPMFIFYLPGYLTWAGQHYRPVPSPAPGAQVYLRK